MSIYYKVWEVQVFGNGSFGSYNWHAFNDKREPETKKDGYGSIFGTFDTIKRNLDIALHPSRIQGGWKITRDKQPREPHGPIGTQQRYDGCIAFTDKDAAIAYAKRLSKYGRWAHAYASDQGHSLKRREEKLKVQVAEVLHAHAETVVWEP